MPLTPNGKIDKNALPFPDTALAASILPSAASSPDKLTPTETSLRDVWGTLLRIDCSNIAPNSNFFDIGGHSILATRLIFAVRKTFAIEAPLGLVYKAPTLSAMASEIDFIRGEDLNLTSGKVAASAISFEHVDKHERNKSYENLQQQKVQDEQFDYFADLNDVDDNTLSAKGFSFTPPSKIFSSGTHPVFFITGATGFLGAFILQSLFQVHPNAVAWCLVRAKTAEQGKERIIDNCKRHLISTNGWSSQVSALVGDLASEKFGLEAENWNELTKSVDIIIHNGALVHWIYPYKKLRGPNVIGTKTALKLACAHHLKPLHFISSTAVLESPHVLFY